MKKETHSEKHPHPRFRNYAFSEIFALSIDLVVLWALVQFTHMHYLVAAGIAYWVALTIHHHSVRKRLFRGTVRDATHTYTFFLGVGVVGFMIMLIFVALAVSAVHLNYVFARIMAALGVIPITYVLNLWLTFIMPKPLPNKKDEYCLIGEHNASS